VTPEQIPQGSSFCSQFEGSGQDWVEFKPQPEPPPSGSYNDGTLFVTITYTSATVIDWTSNIGVDAVIVKGGPDGGYLYRYDPPSEETSDTGLTLPSGGISHITFCYDVPPQGDLTVVKRVVNDDGGQASPGSWTMNVAGPTPLSFPGATDPGTTNKVDSGSYTVTETGPTGYTLTYSGACNAQGQVTVPANGSATCILTNDDNDRPPPPEKGTITVEKQTIPEGYVPPQGGFDFTGAIVADLLDNQSETVEVDAGTYTVIENLDGRPFWDLISIECDDDDSSGDLATKTATYEVDPGEDVTCVFTNQKRSLLIIEKETNPEGAGGNQQFAFETSYGDFSLLEGQDNRAPLPAGDYTVEEIVPDGWELESASCTNGDDPRDGPVELPADEVVTCTFVNAPLEEPDTGTIVVEKFTVPSGDETQFPFDLNGDGFTLADGQTETFDELEAGEYEVSEDTPAGWTLTSDACESDVDQGPIDPSQIDLSEGETVTCTFTNTKDEPETGTIVIAKVTAPADDPTEFDFGFGQGDGAEQFTLSGGDSRTFSGLEPGAYEASEDTPEGWILTSAVCDNGSSISEIEVGEGEKVTCTFTNVKQTVVTGQGSIDVQKSANPTTLKEPGGDVQYSVRITNTSGVNVSITNVVDDKFGDLDDSGGSSCFDVPINLGPGQGVSCVFTKAITGSGGTEHVNTVCADASDEFGHALRDCDDARVAITPRLIDLVIVKEATSPTSLNGTVTYTLTVTNKGPDTATNVVVADPAPAGIQYDSATSSQGSCVVAAAMVTCQLGTLSAGQTATITVRGTAKAVGTHVNTATVTGGGGRETNPGDNTDSAQTVVPQPLTPR
jgi:uncharacterized repeat protein (TIGR01451 family)